MTARLEHIWRHPIKGIGAEALTRATLCPDRPLQGDRAWAVRHQGAAVAAGWQPCSTFLRGAKGPSLMAVTAASDGDRITLSHPDRPDLTASLPDDAPALLDWLRPIYPDTRPGPAALIRAPDQGMSDAPYASVSVHGMSSLRALGQKLGMALDPRRFRGNLWIEGIAPWEEFDWIGKRVRIGDAVLEVVERIGRCRATEANPRTGRRDARTLDALEDGWGHTDFGVYAKVIEGGEVATGMAVDHPA